MTLIALGEDTEGKERERNGKRGQGAAKRKKRLMKGVRKLHTQISVHTCTCKWGRKDEQKFLSEDFQNHKNREISRSPRIFFVLPNLLNLLPRTALQDCRWEQVNPKAITADELYGINFKVRDIWQWRFHGFQRVVLGGKLSKTVTHLQYLTVL